MANPEHVALVKKGAEAIAEWRSKNPKGQLDLSEADFREADLALVDLSEADLTRANLTNVNLSLSDLSDANLTAANLSGSNIRFVLLLDADLSKANFQFACFFHSYLVGATLTEAILNGTSVCGCGLSQCAGLDTVQHDGSSSIGVDTLIASFRGAGNRLTPQLMAFFRGAGVPSELLNALPSIVREIRYYSCFISYGEPDRGFAERLRNDLIAHGVSCWLYAKDHTPGQPSRTEIMQARRQAEKMIIVCSLKGLLQDNFKNEIEDQADEAPDKILPVCLDKDSRHDGFQIKRGGRDLKPFLMEPNYVDFSDPSKYEQSLEGLLTGLRRQVNT